MVSNFDFTVEKRNILIDAETPRLYKDRKALVRTDTNEVLSIVSDRYQPTQHSDVFEMFNQLEGLNYTGHSMTGDGGVCFWNFDIDGEKPREVSVGDPVSFRFRAFNSHNLMTGRGIELIAMRLVCRNGMVLPKSMGIYSFKHMNNDFQRLNSVVEKFKEEPQSVVNLWKRWLTTEPDKDAVNAFVSKLGITQEKDELTLRAEMLQRKNLWEIYNVMTAYLTHEKKNRGVNKIANHRKLNYEYTNLFYKHAW